MDQLLQAINWPTVIMFIMGLFGIGVWLQTTLKPLLEKIAPLLEELADLLLAVASALSDRNVTPEELSRIRKEGRDVVGAVQMLLKKEKPKSPDTETS